jgi:hypothetical protein
MRYRIGEKLRHESTFNNNLPKPTNDVIVNPQNPENPDSKPHAAAHSRLSCSQFLA